MNENQTYSDELQEAFREATELIQYISKNKLSIKEESDTRKILIEIVKLLLGSKEVDPDTKRIIQLILTKLDRWTPFIHDFSGVDDLPVLMGQIVSSFEILMSEEEAGELFISYFMNNISST